MFICVLNQLHVCSECWTILNESSQSTKYKIDNNNSLSVVYCMLDNSLRHKRMWIFRWLISNFIIYRFAKIRIEFIWRYGSCFLTNCKYFPFRNQITTEKLYVSINFISSFNVHHVTSARIFTKSISMNECYQHIFNFIQFVNHSLF